ncbi:MAG TPA: DUF5715 family protein, partial [Silvibacterium sp.]|nr:DUF5715 family protein [Silvibacterium sp.]
MSHSQSAPHGRAYHFQPATVHGHPAGHSAAHAHANRTATHSHNRHRSRSPLEPQSRTVSATIEPQPLLNMHLAPLVGSHESLVRQNERTEADGLTRIEDDAELNELRREKALVAVPVSASLRVNEGLPVNRRYCRPWTERFLTDLSRAHYARF